MKNETCQAVPIRSTERFSVFKLIILVLPYAVLLSGFTLTTLTNTVCNSIRQMYIKALINQLYTTFLTEKIKFGQIGVGLDQKSAKVRQLDI